MSDKFQLFRENYELVNNPVLYAECCGWIELALNESNQTGKCIFQGKFQEANSVNKNKRMYPYDVLAGNVTRLEEAVKNRSLYGELDHPSDSIIHLKESSHLVTKLFWEGNSLMGSGEVLPTPAGMILKKIMDAGGRIGISSRGVGNGNVNNEGVLVIGNSYKLLTFDCVADPSTMSAFQQKIVGGKAENYIPTYTKPNVVNTDALTSYIGCLMDKYKYKVKDSFKK